MRQVLLLDPLEFGLVVVRRVPRPPQQHQLKCLKIHTSLCHRARGAAWSLAG